MVAGVDRRRAGPSIHGQCPGEDLVDAGQQLRGGAPRGPHSSITPVGRAAAGRDRPHRRARPAARPRRCPAGPPGRALMGGPPAAGEWPRPDVRGHQPRRPRPPRAGSPASAPAPRRRRPRRRPRRRRRCRRSPGHADGSTPELGAGGQDHAGPRLAAAAAVLGARAGRPAQTSNGPSSSSTRALTASTCCRSSSPRPMPDWLLTHADGTPGAQHGRAPRGRRHRPDQGGVAVVGHVAHERAVAVEQDGARRGDCGCAHTSTVPSKAST